MDKDKIKQAREQFVRGISDIRTGDVDEAVKNGRAKITELASDIPSSLEGLWRDITQMYELVCDYKAGRYTDVPWKTIAAMVGALAYFITPTDLMPDFLPLVGYVDDAAVISLAIEMIAEDLKKYRRWCQKNAKPRPLLTDRT